MAEVSYALDFYFIAFQCVFLCSSWVGVHGVAECCILLLAKDCTTKPE